MKFSKALLFVALLASICLSLFACDLGGKKMTSLTVDANSYQSTYTVGDTVDFSGIKATAHYNDGGKVELTAADLKIGSLSTAVAGTFTVTVSYEDFSVDLTITVTDSTDTTYEIEGFELPSFVGAYLSAITPSSNPEINYKQDITTYRVGDDNPFFFLPRVTIWGDNGPEELNAYEAVSRLFLIADGTEVELTGDDLTAMVAIDATKSSYDFTEAAVGKTFKLVVCPKEADLGDSLTMEAATLSFTFEVVNAWNVYDVANLSRFDNYADHVDDWATYKANNGIDNTAIQGMVLHTSLTITDADLPASYFYTAEETGNTVVGGMKDFTYAYYRKNGPEDNFTFWGNGFTIDASAVTPVSSDPGEFGYGGDYSNSCLFFMSGPLSNDSHDYTTASFSILRDTSFIGNAGRNNNQEEMIRGLGGLIFAKFDKDNCTVENVIVRQFFIGIFPQYHVAMTIEGCRVYDSLQDAMFVWAGARVTLNNSEFKRAGGPLIVMDHEKPATDTDGLRFPTLTVDDKTVLEANVNGQEVWFVNAGFNNVVAQLSQLFLGVNQVNQGIIDGLIAAQQMGVPGVVVPDEKVVPKLDPVTNSYMVNIISVLRQNGAVDNLDSAGVRGFVEIGGQLPCNMMTGEDANTQVETLRAQLVGLLGAENGNKAIIIQSSGEGNMCLWTDGTTLYYGVNPNGNGGLLTIEEYLGAADVADPALKQQAQIARAMELAPFFDGDYIGVYIFGMCVTVQNHTVEN